MTSPPPRFRFLVPSSDRKKTGGTRSLNFREAQEERDSNRYYSLTNPRERALRRFLSSVNGEGHGAEVLRMSGQRLEKAVSTNLAFPRNPVMPVLERDDGPLFRALGYDTLSIDGQKRMREEVLVVCPLLGLLAPMDLVPEYRCPVGAQIPGWGSLHSYWKPILSPLLNRLCRGRLVLSFLPGRLRALWVKARRSLGVVHVRFARRRADGTLLAESAGSGRVTGELIRYVIERGVTDAAELRTYKTSAGHTFSFVHSDVKEGEQNLVFVR